MADMKDDNGGAAFPVPWPHGPPDEGMSLRDWFAGQALAGMGQRFYEETMPSEGSRAAYDWADAMIAERKRRMG